jgi:hypothetical protein
MGSPLLLQIVLAAWQVFALTNADRDRAVRLTRDVTAAGCETCVSSPPTASDCASVPPFRLDAVHCDPDNSVVNPFAVLTRTLPQRCKLYLLGRAHGATAEIVSSRKLTGSPRAVVELGGSLHFLAQRGILRGADGPAAPECSVDAPIRRLATDVATALEPEYRGVGTYAEEYCSAILPACELMGGKLVRVGRQEICRRGGVVIDRSCLTASMDRRKRVARALASITGQGAQCLSNDFTSAGPGGRSAAQKLIEHFDTSPDLRTQLCCGSGGCTSNVDSVFGRYTQPVSEAYRTMDAIATQTGSGRGIIEITDSGLDPVGIPQAEISATLFHEFLHRIGMATGPFHNHPNGLVPARPGSACPTLGGDTFREESGLCMPTNPCYARARTGSIYRTDAVYACTAACFPGTQFDKRGTEDGTSRHLTPQEETEARQTCGAHAATGNFASTNNLCTF